MATLIQQISEQLASKGISPGTNPGKTWLLQKIKNLRPTAKDRMQLIQQREAQRNKTIIGRFYFFFYNPKLKDHLPYWDHFPLVIPIQRYTDGFLGLNLHYIRPNDRLILLKQLRQFAKGTDENMRLRLSYPILTATHQTYRATPCVKRYLSQHIQSKVIEVPAEEWEIAAALSLQEFKSNRQVSVQDVWNDSEDKY